MPPARTRSTISVTALPTASAVATTTQVRLSCMVWFPSGRDASAHAISTPAGSRAHAEGLAPEYVVRSGWVGCEGVDAPGLLTICGAHASSAAGWRCSPALRGFGQRLPLTV